MSAASAFQGIYVRGTIVHSNFDQPSADRNGFEDHGSAGRSSSGHGNVHPINGRRGRSLPTPAPQGMMGPVVAGRSKQAPLRLTRRGRFVFFGVPLILLAALVLSFSGFLTAPAKAADSADQLGVTPTVSVTVQPGETLWAIAGSVAPERDPRDVVADIVQLNNLDAARVMPGQQLFVPSK